MIGEASEYDAYELQEDRDWRSLVVEGYLYDTLEQYLRFLMMRASPLHVALVHRVLSRALRHVEWCPLFDSPHTRLVVELRAQMIGGVAGERMKAFYQQLWSWQHSYYFDGAGDLEAVYADSADRCFDPALAMDRTDAGLLEKALLAAALADVDPRTFVAAQLVMEAGLSVQKLSHLSAVSSWHDRDFEDSMLVADLNLSKDLVRHVSALKDRNDAISHYAVRVTPPCDLLFQSREHARNRVLQPGWFKKAFAAMAKDLHRFGAIRKRRSLTERGLRSLHRNRSRAVISFGGYGAWRRAMDEQACAADRPAEPPSARHTPSAPETHRRIQSRTRLAERSAGGSCSRGDRVLGADVGSWPRGFGEAEGDSGRPVERMPFLVRKEGFRAHQPRPIRRLPG